ncbi:DUF1294 domain-containing protein [Chryseobacterium sp. L7]|uniref:DUF1294 domain-containing protein n=1 Tax=Chryseobacterium endalhagicum TaxID=2797638 RepID=A0ABS1QDM3_9FLAO|nr:DUF1294 domain-containing protein [Chryseobacterium endalhagicum]MBL1220681.1 DUF1294 domain-containing protein [Chryseobacterium endalhagicum]
MIYIFLFLSLLTFIVFGWDKRLAVKHKKRISENTLLGLTLIGGTAGAVLGMLLFRHKISKKSFLLKFAGIVLIQIVCIYFFRRYW